MYYQQNWEKIKAIVDNVPVPNEDDNIFLFGAGGIGEISAKIITEMMRIEAFCDNDTKKQGTIIAGLPCVSPTQLLDISNPFVFITTPQYVQNIQQQLDDLKIRSCTLDAYVMRTYWSEFEEAYQLLDEDSKEVYAGILLCRLTGNTRNSIAYCTDNQYFCIPQFKYLCHPNEVVIDCGAYVGDTLEQTIWASAGLMKKIYAFEPNIRSFTAMKKRVSYLKDVWALSDERIICEQKGVGAKTSIMSVHVSSTRLSAGYLTTDFLDASNQINVVSLDDYLLQQEEEKVTFIKADIEGFEWDMLHGAARTIQKDKPKLAICIYHSAFDLFRIQKYLKELVPEYQFHVRYHGGDTLIEIVLYCHV